MATLAALAAQTDLNGCPLQPQSYEVLLLVNNYDDETVLIARRWSQQHPELVLHIAELRYLPPKRMWAGPDIF